MFFIKRYLNFCLSTCTCIWIISEHCSTYNVYSKYPKIYNVFQSLEYISFDPIFTLSHNIFFLEWGTSWHLCKMGINRAMHAKVNLVLFVTTSGKIIFIHQWVLIFACRVMSSWVELLVYVHNHSYILQSSVNPYTCIRKS